jgi:hypothetical protein
MGVQGGLMLGYSIYFEGLCVVADDSVPVASPVAAPVAQLPTPALPTIATTPATTPVRFLLLLLLLLEAPPLAQAAAT